MHQSIFHYKDIYRIYDIFRSIENHLIRRLRIKTNFRPFLNHFVQNASICWFFFGLLISAKVIWVTSKTNALIEIQYNFLRVIVILPKVYALFFISLFKTFIKMTNEYLRENGGGSGGGGGEVAIPGVDTMIRVNIVHWHRCHVIDVIKHYKYLHFKLFTAAAQINETFGWSLVTICAETLLENAYMVYWTFYYWHKDGQEFYLITSNTFYLLMHIL